MQQDNLTEYEDEIEESDGLLDEETEEVDWLELASDAYRKSESYYTGSVRKPLERNIRYFNNKHASGSKYGSESYKYRSKIFRPKTRATIRRQEAAASTAFFATKDVVSCKAVNQDDHEAVVGAILSNRLMNYRLSEPSMRWFQTVIGAYQDAMVQGPVISSQEWCYEELDGEIAKDRPDVRIVPLENIRFDPNCDWRDPVKDSPYIIELIPMYHTDVKKRMEYPDKAGRVWNYLSDEVISQSSSTLDYNIDLRNLDKQNPKLEKYLNSEFDIVWVHKNIITYEGVDYLYYTLGEIELLSDPEPLKDVFPIGRHYVVGSANIEAHKTIPSSNVEIGATMQQELNDIVNQRLDNVKLVTNRRSFVKRAANIDIRSMTQSVPGGVVLVEDINNDVRYDAPPDVTSSSYVEQDRLSNDFDELMGAFSGSSVASNRAMNETVGGMEIMTADANSLTEYQIKIFAETWLKPVLQQLFDLERIYENDQKILSSISGSLNPEIAISLIRKDIKLDLSVGFGSTNPQKRIETMMFGMNAIAQLAPEKVRDINTEEVIREVFGALGFQDGERFFSKKEEDPRLKQMEQQLQQMQAALQNRQLESQTKLQVEQIRQQGNLQTAQIKSQAQLQIAELKKNIDYIEKQIEAEQNDIKRGQLIISRDAFIANKKNKELELSQKENERLSDILMNDKYGLAPGVEERPGMG